MSHKTDQLLVKSVKELDHLVIKEEKLRRATFSNDISSSKIKPLNNAKVVPKELTIYSAIENYLKAERYMTSAKHEKAYLCLIRFLKEIQSIESLIIDNGVHEKEHYAKYRDIYDYYMSDEVMTRTFQKLTLLRDYLHCLYISINEMSSHDHQKCDSLHNDISVAATEPLGKQSKKSFDIFNINNVLKNPNYISIYGSDRYTNLIFERINRCKPMLRKCVSIPDMKRNLNENSLSNQNIITKKPLIQQNAKEYSVFNRVKNFKTGYSYIIAPLIVKQTLNKIEEYKQKVEFKPKPKDSVEWKQNRQIFYM